MHCVATRDMGRIEVSRRDSNWTPSPEWVCSRCFGNILDVCTNAAHYQDVGSVCNYARDKVHRIQGNWQEQEIEEVRIRDCFTRWARL